MHIMRLRLTILAIALPAMFVGTGGAICLDALPLPWLQVDCPDPCCNTDDECCPGERTPVPSSPSWPARPDCCIGGSLDYLLPGQVWLPLADPGPAQTYCTAPARTVPGLHRVQKASATP